MIKDSCFEYYNCCDCGGAECGCRYCFSCKACDSCMKNQEDDGDRDCEYHGTGKTTASKNNGDSVSGVEPNKGRDGRAGSRSTP